MNSMKHILYIIFLIIPSLAYSFNNNMDTLHIKEWKILYKQSKSLGLIKKKSNWKQIDITSKIKLPYPSKREFQYAWLKATIEIDKPEKYYGISFGRVYNTYRVYLNDKLLGYRSPGETENIHLPANLTIPQGALKKGINEIYIYLGVFRVGFNGGLPDGVKIQTRENHRRLTNWHNLIYNIIPLSVILLLLLGIVRTFIAFLMDRKQIFFLYAMLMMIFYCNYIFLIFSPYKLVKFYYVPSLLAISGPLLGIIFVLIIQSLYHVKLNEQNRILFPILIFGTGSTIFAELYMETFYINPIIGFVVTILFMLYATYMIYSLNKLKPDRFKFYATLILVNLMSFGGTLETAFLIMGDIFPYIITPFFSPLLIIGLTLLGMRDSQNRIFELRLLYENLRKAKGVSKKTITNSTEEKIKVILDFIQKNYKSDISREGLASAVGMNPNYFSSQFKEYTGKKINDYINELRINNAVEKLRDSEIRIIDVALSSGFDCLSTFNRLFKIVMKKSPTDYRKELKS
ncbi:helix-turn-helix transcriptional regulator [Spirochaetota bacterium]